MPSTCRAFVPAALRQALHRRAAAAVAIARAVLHDPPVLILDEPTSGLDVLASRFLRELVYGAREHGKAILFSTRYLAEAELLCNRIGFLHRGRTPRRGDAG